MGRREGLGQNGDSVYQSIRKNTQFNGVFPVPPSLACPWVLAALGKSGNIKENGGLLHTSMPNARDLQWQRPDQCGIDRLARTL